MKILHLIQKPQNRGAETFACQLANHQIELGHEVMIISIFTGIAELPWRNEIISIQGSTSNRFFDFSAWKQLANYIEEFKPDIIQANAGDTLKYAIFSKLFFKWKTPIVFRNASEVGRYLSSNYQKIFNRFLYERLDGVISVSHASKKDLLRHFPFLVNLTQVIPIGLEEKLNIEVISLKPEGKQHIVHVGGFSFEKNHQGLISIFQKVLNANDQTHLHLVGDGPLRLEIENLVKERKLEDKVSFYGFVNNPLSYIKSADVLILPSKIEGLPGVLLEAMYCKTPVVAYDVGGISEIVSNRTGSLIKKGEEELFAAAIQENLVNPNIQKINFAFEQVCEHYMNSEISENFTAFYKDLQR
ncbi:MAG: glycosyltransferase [Candidatus Bathyarchaeota archaeon]|nr:glycosyltransferase [Candidatus Bathyarchaeota archaeon]